MIYFTQDTLTKAIKIGYSKNPKKRLAGLQTATPNELVLLGTIPGGLEHEEAFHAKFVKHKLQGEWFKGDILREVLGIIAREAAAPRQASMNVIVWADCDFNRQVDFAWSSDADRQASKDKAVALVLRTLNELHTKTPMAYVIVGSGRGVDSLAWQWAKDNRVQVYCYAPNWRRYGKGAATKVGSQMLRSMFDPKLLLVFQSSMVSKNTKSLIRRATKAGIEVVTARQA